MEVTKAEIDAVLDAQGRFVWTPHALTLDGQQNIACDLQEGETLLAFLRRHVPGIESGAWTVSIGGAVVPRRMWAKTYPKHGMHIACRATVGKQAVQLVAVAVLSYFTLGMGGMAAGSFMGLTGAVGYAAAIGVFVAGSMLINKVLGPKVPKPGEGPGAARQIYSLSGQRNSARPYEPVPVLFGEMRVTPDLAANPYTFFAGDEQYLVTHLLGGVNVHHARDLAIGDTALDSYQEVETYFDGFAGHPQQTPPLYGNADSIPGGELVSKDGSAGWVLRTSSENTIRIEVDVEGQLFHMSESGDVEPNSSTISVEVRKVGSVQWQRVATQVITGRGQDTIRRTIGFDTETGAHDVRVMASAAIHAHESRSQVQLVWATMRSLQEDTADYSQFGRISIKMKATGQISGSLDTVRATYRAKPMSIWTGTAWATATTRENGLSNPGAILLQTLRGIWHKGRLQFGFGLSDEQIDIEGLKAFMLHCAANGYTYDKWITSSISLQEFCQEVALAGMGEFSWTDGSRPTAVFVSSGQPISAVVNMANMLKASFAVDYALSNAADGIEYQYVDRAKKFETQTLRVSAPGITTPLNPARITGEGVTDEAHAARMARYHLAQSLYQYKTINFGADIEHLDYRRLSVLSVSHDLTQWGFGGRVMAAKRVAGRVHIQLDEVVPPLTNPHLGLRLPGDRDYRVFPVLSLTSDSDTLVLNAAWPAGVALPGEGDDAMDTLWCYDFKATPGYRVRVTSMEPEGDLQGAKVTCVPEGPEFWDYVLNGTYVPAPGQSALPQRERPEVRNLRVNEQTNAQGNTEWYQLNVVWDSTGEVDHCQVWAGLDGSELRLVDAMAMGGRSSVRIDEPGQWLLRVVPFDAGGKAGQAASLLYITTQVGLAPSAPADFVVHTLEGGLRRFAWQWPVDRPVNLAGVQIRYKAGSSALASDWGSMTPLGDAYDVYTAQFETTRPDGGLWTFGLRAINTSGQLSAQMRTATVDLPDSLPQIQAPDLTPPPAPTGLAVQSGLATVMVRWDAPSYEQGHGHARTELWAATTEDRAQAIKVAEGYAGPSSFNAEPATTYYVWARHVTNDGVAGPWTGPVSGATGQNPGKLLEVLEGQITSSQLHEDLSAPIAQIDRIDFGRIELLNDVPVPVLQELPELARIDFERIDLLNEVPVPELQKLAAVDLSRIEVIDRIDKAGGPLGKSLLDAAASLESTQQQVRLDMNEMAQGLLEAALAADAALERITDAGVYVDPVSGQVKIYGLEATKEEVTNLEIMLDAVAGQLALKATTAYVDGKIAEAVLSPADLLLYEGLDARLVQVTQTLDSINGTLTQKANALELQDAVARLTTAENTLDALSGQIALRVTRAEYQADQNALQQRLSSAEILLNTLDVPSITATVQAAQGAIQDAERQAQALLQDILTGERNREQAQEALAFARTELSAAITEGLQAEAQQRTQLAVQFGQSLAAVQQELTSLSAADVAEAQARMALTAQVQQGLQTLTAALETEQRVRADADAAEVLARESLKAQLEGVDDALLAAIEEEESARVTADQAEAAARQQLAARLDGKDGELQAAIVAEQAARASGDAAEATQRQLLAATVAANRTEGLDAVEAAFGAIASEQTARANADAALAQRVDQVQAGVAGNTAALASEQAARVSSDSALAQRVDQVQAGVASNVAGIQAEQTARVSADAALGQRIDSVQAVVGNNTAAIQAEQQARADALGAQALRTEALIAVSRKQSQADAERNAEALLQSMLAADAAKERLQQDIAVVRSEASARLEEGLLAEAQQRDLLQAQIGEQAAALQIERIARADGDAAEARQRDVLAAQVQQGQQQLAAQIQAEAQARADADAAEATQRNLLAATVEANRTEGLGAVDVAFAAIASEQAVRASADAALAQRVDQVQAGVAGNTAAIEAEQAARASGDAAEALARQNLQATVEANRTEGMNAVETAFGAIASEQSVRAAADEALGQRIDVVQASVVDYTAAIHGEQQARADAISAEARRTDALLAVSQKQAVTDAERTAEALLQDIVSTEQAKERMRQDVAMVRSEAAARLEEGLLAEAQQRQQLIARLDGQAAALESESLTRATADQAEALQREQLAASVQQGQQQLAAQIQSESQARADGDAAEAMQRQQLVARMQTAEGDIDAAYAILEDEQDVRASADEALGSRITALQATVGENTAAIQTEQSVRATETGHLGAQWTLRMQLGQGGQQVVGGIGLSGTSGGTAGTRIDFGVLANSFWVAAPNGAGVAMVKPFSVQTTAQNVNGVVVPAGVYMDAAYINNVTALWGKFGTLVADTVQATAISAGQLTAGNGVIGGSLKSSNYVAGSSGWTLRPDGVAEFSGVTVRGTVYATSGAVGGWSMGANYLRSSNYQAGVRGVHLGSDGTVEIRSADGQRVFNLGAASDQPVLKVPGLEIRGDGFSSFSGSLNGATGTFTGQLNVKSATSGARLEISGSQIRVYDANGTLRVRMGVW